jgi:hypothetical protein
MVKLFAHLVLKNISHMRHFFCRWQDLQRVLCSIV